MFDYHRFSCISLGLFIYVQSSLGRTCNVDFTDVLSKSYKADHVFDVLIRRVQSVRSRGSKEVIAKARVNEVLKGTFDKKPGSDRYPSVIIGFFGYLPLPERCLAPMPQEGSRYVLFLQAPPANFTGFRKRDDRPAAFLISDFPEPFSEELAANVHSSKRTEAKKPRVRLQLVDPVYEIGETARLRCLTSGWPRPKVTWYKDGAQLHNTTRQTLLDTKNGASLTILNMSASDFGLYRCQATNVVGSTSLRGKNGALRLTRIIPSTTPMPNPDDHRVPCTPPQNDYCINNGICFVVPSLDPNKMYCSCPSEFRGDRCEEKRPPYDVRLVMGTGSKKLLIM